MRYLKVYEEFVSKDFPVKYKRGEFEVKEMFRIFAQLQDKLPKEIDISIFDMSKENFGEPREFERHIDPKFKSNQYTTEELKSLKEFTIEDENNTKVKVDSSKYIPFIEWSQSLFNSGKMYQATTEDIKKIAYDSKEIGRADFRGFLEDTDLISKLQKSYYKNTWEVLDKQIREGEVSASSVISIDGKMYLVGGNRRMAFYIGSGINPQIWKIEL